MTLVGAKGGTTIGVRAKLAYMPKEDEPFLFSLPVKLHINDKQ